MARLLWRGSLQLHNSNYNDVHTAGAAAISPQASSSSFGQHHQQQQLHGLAMVASSFKLSHSHQQQQQHDPDDPFSSSSSPFKIDTTAELCLDIEMLRNSPLFIEERRARVKIASLDGEEDHNLDATTAQLGLPKPHGRKALKKSIEMLRKGKQKLSLSSLPPETVFIDFEQDSNLSLYIDQRCHDTVQYFNDFFCKEPVDERTGRTSIGLAVALEREDELGISSGNAQRKIVIYGQIAPGPHTSRPILHLHVAKYRNKRQTTARPDAPAPRGEYNCIKKTTPLHALIRTWAHLSRKSVRSEVEKDSLSAKYDVEGRSTKQECSKGKAFTIFFWPIISDNAHIATYCEST